MRGPDCFCCVLPGGGFGGRSLIRGGGLTGAVASGCDGVVLLMSSCFTGADASFDGAGLVLVLFCEESG